MPLECFDGAKISYFFYISKLFREKFVYSSNSWSFLLRRWPSLLVGVMDLHFQVGGFRVDADALEQG